MSYRLFTPDGKYERHLSNHECKTILREALKHGWKPSARHLCQGGLRLTVPFNADDARALAAAIERGIPAMTVVSPPLVVTMLESISVLRRGDACFEECGD